MNCKNCSSEIPDNAVFCPVCGEKCEEPVKTEENTQPAEAAQKTEETAQQAETQSAEENTAGAYVSFAPEGKEPAEAAPKKGKKGKVAAIVAAVLLVAVIGIGVTAHAQIANFFRSTFSDAASYYRYVEKKNCENQSKVAVNLYGKMRDSLTVTSADGSASYRLEIGQSLKTMLSMTGLDCSALDSVELTASEKTDENTVAGQIGAFINDESVLSFKAYVDAENKEGYFQIPELSSKFVDFSKTLKEDEELSGISDLWVSKDIEKYFLKQDQVETLIKTYTDLFIENMDQVEKGSAEIEAGGVKSTYTDLKVTCKADKVKDVLLKCFNALKEDATIKEYLENVGEDAYTEFTEGVSEVIEKLDATPAESYGEAVMDVYVDGSGDIAGRVIRLTDAEDTIVITYLEPQNGSELGSEISLSDGDKTLFKLSGKGTRKGGKISGEYTLGLDPSLAESLSENIINMEELLTIKVTDLDEDTFEEDGYLNGSFVLSSKAIASFTSYEIQMDFKEDKNESTRTFSVVCGGDKLASLIAKSENSSELENVKPDEGSEVCDASDQEQLEQWMAELKWEDLLSSIKEKSGVDLSTYWAALESWLDDEDEDVYASEGDEYSLDDDDYSLYKEYDDFSVYESDDEDYSLYDSDEYDSEDEEGGLLGLSS